MKFNFTFILLFTFILFTVSFCNAQGEESVPQTPAGEDTLNTGEEPVYEDVITLEGHNAEVTCVTFSPPWYEFTKEKLAALKDLLSPDKFEFLEKFKEETFTRLYVVSELENYKKDGSPEEGFTEEEIKTVLDNTFNAGKGFLTSGSQDATVRLWDIENKKEIASLVSMDQGDWAVVTPEGFFDGTPRGIRLIRWRINDELFLLEQFFNDFYHPGLLADIYSQDKPKIFPEILRDRGEFKRAELNIATIDRRLPEVTIKGYEQVNEREVKITVHVEEAPPNQEYPDKGSGIKDVRLFRNGLLVYYWPGEQKPGDLPPCTVPITAEENEFIAYAFNDANVKSIDSEPLSVTGASSLKGEPVAYILAIGNNDYAGPYQDLKYAVDDAKALSEELKTNLPKNITQKREITPCENATRETILKELIRIVNIAKPEDTVIIIYSGHGEIRTIDEQNRFFIIPSDFAPDKKVNDITDEDFIKDGISDTDLEAIFVGNKGVLEEKGLLDYYGGEEVQALQAENIALILDCCHSGQALEAEEWRVGPMNSRGLAQLAWEKGMEILTASQSDQFAWESKEEKHGLLTSALLDGFKEASYEEEKNLLPARIWLDYAVEEVPRIAEEGQYKGKGLIWTEQEEDESGGETLKYQTPRVFHKREGGGEWPVAEKLLNP